MGQYGRDGGTTENGYLLYQDIVYKPWELLWTSGLPLHPFSTDTYNTHIYAYENDLLYAFIIANIYGEGQRVLCHGTIQPYRLARYLDQIWSYRLYRPRYYWQRNETIEETESSELRLQVRFKW